MTKPESTIERVGAYRVVRRLATGGTSDVLLAKAEGPHGFERNVVLKILLSEFGGDDEIKGMFVREAAAYARLAHPAIVRLFDFFAVPAPQPGQPSAGKEGQLVMVLEHVDGPALSRLRSMLKAVGQELMDEAVIYIAARIFSALAAAHATTNESGALAPVIHRDVNPSNVLVPWDGDVKLADFGVAKVTGVSHQSVAGLIRGTYGYMAPEQVTGATVTPRADVYAAAIILWELLTKRRAFQRGALPETEALRAMAEPHLVSIDVARPELDRAVRDALKRALEPRADRRTVTAEEMVSILSSVVAPDIGRERLVAALASMRDDARARSVAESTPRPSTIPPPVAADEMTPLAPSASAVRMAEVGRRTAKLPATPGSRPKIRPSRPNLPAAKPGLPPPVPKPVSRAGIPAAAPAKASSATTLLIGSAGGAAPTATAKVEKVSESLIETPRAPAVERLVEATRPPGAATPKGPGHAMDEILRAVPSSMPPSVLEAAARADRGGVDTPRMGHIPAAPAPLQARPVDALAATLPPDASSPPTPRMMPLARTMLLGPLVDPPPSDPDGLRFSPLAPPLPGVPVAGSGPPVPSGSSPYGPPTPPMPYGPMPVAPAPPPASPPPMPYGPMPVAPPSPAPVGPAPSPSPRRASPPPPGMRVGVALALVGGVLVLGIAGLIGLSRYVSTRSETRPRPTGVPSATEGPPSSTASAPVPPPPPPVASVLPETSAAPEVAPSAAPPPSGPPDAPSPPASGASASANASASAEGTGLLVTSGAAAGHRIFVDERVVGQTPQSVSVPCGKHSVRLGSAGKPQPVEVPCNGEVTVGDKDR